MVTTRIASVSLFLLALQVSARRWNLFDTQSKEPQEGGVRLVGSNLPHAGRVEVYHDGKWGTICDDGWDMPEAEVVCRQLGFPGAVSAMPGESYGQGSGPLWLDDVNCDGSENTLSRCRLKDWGVSDCSHKEDAGVVCKSEKDMNISHSFTLDHSTGLSERLGALFDSGVNCDFSILVHDPSEEQAEQKTICVHRLILSLWFNVTKNSENLTVEIDQTCHPYVSIFFRYLYTRQIDVTISSAQCLHKLSYMFELHQLLEDVGRVFVLLLPQDDTFRTQVSLYEYGVSTKDMLLQENVLQHLSWNFEFLIGSPVWKTISIHMMEALLSRSDLVVPDEASLLQALEDWIQESGDAVDEENKINLLNQIRFSMIPAEKLFDVQFNSSLYKSNEAFYHAALLKGFQFNTLAFSKIRKHFTNIEGYIPRVYTAAPWSTVIQYTSRSVSNNYQNLNSRSFSTPIHNSVIYKHQTINWQAQVLLHSWECSNQGFRCDSFPVARLFIYNSNDDYRNIVRFSNRVILTCMAEKIVFHVQDFKSDKAYISTNTSVNLTHPCPDDYHITFVVRPEYI